MPKEYMYAVDRNNDYLAHYGIKGMKWKVKKAIDRNDRRAYKKQYKKATRKLRRLERYANPRYDNHKKVAFDAAKVLATGGLVVSGAGNPKRLLFKTSAIGYNVLRKGTSKKAAEKAAMWREAISETFRPEQFPYTMRRKMQKRAR